MRVRGEVDEIINWDIIVLFMARSRYNVILNHANTPYNGGLPYIGVMIGSGPNNAGVTCAYLTPFSDKLKGFLMDM